MKTKGPLKYLAVTLAFISAFTFFVSALPYQLMRREQLNLFLYDSDYILQTYRGNGWLSRFAGDFVEQFLCYPLLGPMLIALIVTGIGVLIYKICREALGPKTSHIIAFIFFAWAVGRETDYRFMTQYSIAVVGYLSLLLAALHFRKKWMKPVAAVVFLAVGTWMLGSPYQKYYGKFWSKPNFLYENVIGMDVEASRENWDKVLKMRATPGWEKVYTTNSASQIGVRGTRLVETEFVIGRKEIANGFDTKDVIGWCGHDGPHAAFPICYRQLVPKKVDNLLCAGRCLGTGDTIDTFRLICPCFVTGEAAGTAAALAATTGVRPRDLDVTRLRRTLEKNRAYVG